MLKNRGVKGTVLLYLSFLPSILSHQRLLKLLHIRGTESKFSISHEHPGQLVAVLHIWTWLNIMSLSSRNQQWGWMEHNSPGDYFAIWKWKPKTHQDVSPAQKENLAGIILSLVPNQPDPVEELLHSCKLIKKDPAGSSCSAEVRR